jgi:poly(A) polymerase
MKDTARQVCRILQDNGFQAVFVGGCVRDMLLGREPHDFDLATDAAPEQVEGIFTHSLPIGKAFGVITVQHDGFSFEVATFRRDGVSVDGRHPMSIEFSTIEADARRRDFTINGMSYDPISDTLHDFVGGERDLKAGVVRFIGDAEERIQEDSLRVLRAIRFAAELNFTLADPQILVGRTLTVSPERIKAELDKMLMGSHPAEAIQMVIDADLNVLPELDSLLTAEHTAIWHAEGTPWVHTLLVLDAVRKQSRDIDVLWAALLHDMGKGVCQKMVDGRLSNSGHAEKGAEMAVELLTRLKSSSRQIEKVEFLVANHMRIKLADEMKKSKVRRLRASEFYADLLLLSTVDSSVAIPSDPSLKTLDWLKTLAAMDAELPARELPSPLVTGHDLLAMGLKPSPLFGTLLTIMMDAQLDERISTREEALAMLMVLVRDWTED